MAEQLSMQKPAGFAAFEKVLRRLDSDELFALGERVEQVTSQQGWDDLMGLLNGLKENLLVELIHGPIHRHERYAALSSQISGLETVKTVAEAVAYAVVERTAELNKSNREADARDERQRVR